MKEIFFSLILGTVQGITEFLPISSSGHLIIFHNLLKSNLLDSLSFDAFLHLGTLVALLIYFRKDLGRFIFSFLKKKDQSPTDRNTAILVLIAFLPAAVIGFIFNDKIDLLFRSVRVVSLAMILGGAAIYFFDKYSLKNKEIFSLSKFDSLIIGLAQVLAFIPGVSRSAITIITGLGLNLKREEAARFSFLLAIPITFAAGLKSFYDLISSNTASEELGLLLVGFLAAAFVGYFCVKYFLSFLKNHSLKIFVIYRVVAGILLLLFFR